MSAGSSFRAYEAMRGWWATAIRALSLMLALALVAPGAIHSAEGHTPAHHDLSITVSADSAAPGHSDTCPACHANCGCHQAISPEGTSGSFMAATASPTYATLDVTVASVSPDRLPRPPRA
ncbi:hypothetical protein [Methylobacterium gnaphalii]|uniref:DUF2946 domain-containing protein n=1 Tax=Methylobacterium gnaphalii TaxID=1010610 RepID=A0A512JFZ6_9HYPH|nr:hypothetical protein [Methylobacterium gnaphalii]GEP08874.1 hypothetical protein MGN01_07190 [Methylobacterium gnaphalii]GLS47639.1 hypothetical protein GCM10007885_04830 [Methylobacterium gnaphalii]